MLIVFAQDDWDIYSFHINSTVTSRYAITVITSRVVNRMDESKEIEFQVRIPKNAFISKFKMCVKQKKEKRKRRFVSVYRNALEIMCLNQNFFLVCFRLIDGKEYDGVVKAKEQAQQQYSDAVSRGESAGMVRYIMFFPQ